MVIPTKPGHYKARVPSNLVSARSDDCDSEWQNTEWTSVRVFYESSTNELRLQVPGVPDSFPVLDDTRSVVDEWGDEIVVDEFQNFIYRLERIYEEAKKDEDGSIGKFQGVPVTERLTKKALMGIVVKMAEHDRASSYAIGMRSCLSLNEDNEDVDEKI